MKRLTERQKSRILLLAKTLTVPEIAAKTKLAQQRIRRYLHTQGVEPLRAWVPPLADVAEVQRVLVETGSYEATATHFGVTKQAVYARVPKRRRR